MEDISTYSNQNFGSTAAPRFVDAVVELYQPDHSYKYIDISPTTTISDLIHRGVNKFYPEKFVVSPPDEYCICNCAEPKRANPKLSSAQSHDRFGKFHWSRVQILPEGESVPWYTSAGWGSRANLQGESPVGADSEPLSEAGARGAHQTGFRGVLH